MMVLWWSMKVRFQPKLFCYCYRTNWLMIPNSQHHERRKKLSARPPCIFMQRCKCRDVHRSGARTLSGPMQPDCILSPLQWKSTHVRTLLHENAGSLADDFFFFSVYFQLAQVTFCSFWMKWHLTPQLFGGCWPREWLLVVASGSCSLSAAEEEEHSLKRLHSTVAVNSLSILHKYISTICCYRSTPCREGWGV